MKRRLLIGLLGGAVAPRAFAQRIFHLATLTPTLPMDPKAPPARFLLATLAKHGYRLGENLTYELVGARGDSGKLPELVAGLKSRGVDVVVTTGYPTTMAAQQAGIPTVVAQRRGRSGRDRPGREPRPSRRQRTGISDVASSCRPSGWRCSRSGAGRQQVAMLWNADDLGMTLRYKDRPSAAQGLGIRCSRSACASRTISRACSPR